jgi:hypothetical protein
MLIYFLKLLFIKNCLIYFKEKYLELKNLI